MTSSTSSTAVTTTATITNTVTPGVQTAVVVSSAAPRTAVTVNTATMSVGQTEATGVSTGTPLLQRVSRPAGFAQLVQTATGKHILLTSSPQAIHHAPTVAAGTGPGTANTTGKSFFEFFLYVGI